MIQYLILDDETAAHEVIADYASELPHLSLQKNCYHAFEAMDYLNNHSVDLIFLDINMPRLSGFEFLKTLPHPPKIIVTTAYSDFALEGFELNVLDYLLKPFSFSRFVTAINKLDMKLTETTTSRDEIAKPKPLKTIFVKDNKRHFQLRLEQLMVVEAYGNYVKLHLKDQTLTTHQTLSSFQEKLPSEQFMRVHKSFLVAVDKIEHIEGNRIYIDKHRVPIGQTYKKSVNKLLL